MPGRQGNGVNHCARTSRPANLAAQKNPRKNVNIRDKPVRKRREITVKRRETARKRRELVYTRRLTVRKHRVLANQRREITVKRRETVSKRRELVYKRRLTVRKHRVLVNPRREISIKRRETVRKRNEITVTRRNITVSPADLADPNGTNSPPPKAKRINPASIIQSPWGWQHIYAEAPLVISHLPLAVSFRPIAHGPQPNGGI